MLVSTIMKESAFGANLKAEIINEDDSLKVKYYINDALSGITNHNSNTDLNVLEEIVEKWFNNVKTLNG